jgi:hypothetical protein
MVVTRSEIELRTPAGVARARELHADSSTVEPDGFEPSEKVGAASRIPG